MNRGGVLQYSSPSELYLRPASRFAAKFLGEANLIDIEELYVQANGSYLVKTIFGLIPASAVQAKSMTGCHTLVIRPENLNFCISGSASPEYIPPIPVSIESEMFLGSRSLVTVVSAGGRLLVECLKEQIPPSNQQTWISWKISAAVLLEN